MTDFRYKGEGYCTKCQRHTSYGRFVSPLEHGGKWRFLCEGCRDDEGLLNWEEDLDMEEQAADHKLHMLRDEGKI